MKKRIVVANEHTLGIISGPEILPEFSYLEILRASVLKGSPFDYLSGRVLVGPNCNIRLATLADFEAFRVSSKGFFENETEYEMIR